MKIIMLIVLLIPISLYSDLLTVSLDGSGDYTSIQSAIDFASEGDEILVFPGRYYENINPMGKSNLSVYSLEYTTGDDDYIATTIIDGNQNGACFTIRNGEQNWLIRGFSITGGSGYIPPNKCVGAGGAIHIYLTSLFIYNCNIYNNYAHEGGAIFTSNSYLNLSGVSIHDNFAYEFGGGLIFNAALIPGVPVFEIVFDPDNRCSIYHNYGPVCQDLFLQRTEDAEVYLDTVTVAEPGNSFIFCRDGTYTLDYQNYLETEIDADIYVAPWGDDNDNGLSASTPWQTIHKALYMIKSNPENPKTVHLAEGTYRYSEGQSPYPLVVKSYVTLQGAGSGETVLDCEGDDIINFTLEEQGCYIEISGLTIKNFYSNFVSPLGSCYVNNIDLFDLEFYNNQVEQLAFNPIAAIKFYCPTDLYMENIYIHNCSSDNCAGMNIDNIINGTFRNIVIENCFSYGNDDVRALMRIVVYDGDVLLENIRITDNILHTNCDFNWRNCLALNIFPWSYISGTITLSNSLIANNTCIGEYDRYINFLASGSELNLINNTFIDNTSNYYTTGVAAPVINYYNNISRNEDGWTDLELMVSYQNGLYPEIIPSEINIGCNNIEDGTSGVGNYNNVSTINWLEGNIDEYPDFDETADWEYSLLPSSPCVNTGTENITGSYEFPLTDLAGNQRVWGDCIDMGCYECQIVEIDEFVIQNSKLKIQNYPNPFNPSTTIFFSTNEDTENAEISIYNIKGQLVRSFKIQNSKFKISQVVWDGNDENGKRVSSGVYFYQLNLDDRKATVKKCLLLK
jgi:hypothetical protein